MVGVECLGSNFLAYIDCAEVIVFNSRPGLIQKNVSPVVEGLVLVWFDRRGLLELLEGLGVEVVGFGS